MSIEDEELEKDLRIAVLQAVLNGYSDAVRKGGEELNEFFSKTRTTGPQALDYLPPEKGEVREGGGGKESADRYMAALENNNYSFPINLATSHTPLITPFQVSLPRANLFRRRGCPMAVQHQDLTEFGGGGPF